MLLNGALLDVVQGVFWRGRSNKLVIGVLIAVHSLVREALPQCCGSKMTNKAFFCMVC